MMCFYVIVLGMHVILEGCPFLFHFVLWWHDDIF